MSAPPLLLALHSSSETLAVAVQPLGAAEVSIQSACFPLGRDLSNALLPCLEEVLPAEQWRTIGRLVVATGPGGFTGTRLTVVLARTLAQQLGVPLHGFSSFLLIARRLSRPGGPMEGGSRFWLTQDLPRRGTVAGCYGPQSGSLGGVAELQGPRLFGVAEPGPWAGEERERSHPACVEPDADVRELVELGQLVHAQGIPGPWQPVLPIYPTSPVEGA